MTFKFNSGAGGQLKLNSRRFPSAGLSAYQPTTTGGGGGGGLTSLAWYDPGADGSSLFAGNAGSYLSYTDSPVFNFSGDFTIEWWQNASIVQPFPRIWQFGTYPSTAMGVSIEGGGTTFYLWGNGGVVASFGLPPGSDIWNKTLHFAIVRNSGILTIYLNGTSYYSVPDSTTYGSGGNPLTLGKGGATVFDGEAFGGYISNFRISSAAKYTSNFTPSTTALVSGPDTIFLHRSVGLNIEGSWTGTVSSYSVSANTASPFPPLPAPIVSGGTLFSDATYNYRVFTGNGTVTVENLPINVDVLMVAGGGGGWRGGGGAGGILALTSQYLAPGSYPVTIGNGGNGFAENAENGTFSASPGGNTTFNGNTAIGGGQGSGPGYPVGDGGSGGGGWAAGGLSLMGQGKNGGSGPGGGGGGAGTAGANGANLGSIYGGAGGNGLNTWATWASVTGTGVSGYYAGGGAGGSSTDNYFMAGGLGGGGNGSGSSPYNQPTVGTPNTGGGGGGGNQFFGGVAGGSGILIIRYLKTPTPAVQPATITGGTLSADMYYYYRTFTASNPLEVSTAPANVEVLAVAGGGAGGVGWGYNNSDLGAGGGAGGALYGGTTLAVGSYPVLVGAGGTASNTLSSSCNGANSSIDTLIAIGGGVGKNSTLYSGQNGGSGGGFGGLGTLGQGYDGGTQGGSTGNVGAGGGGAGQAGFDTWYTSVSPLSEYRGKGGAGTNIYSDWMSATGLGVNGYIAGGGGGFNNWYGGYVTSGGLGGGGRGGDGWGGPEAAASGASNTGGGGGGGWQRNWSSFTPGNGGSGVVIVRYPK